MLFLLYGESPWGVALNFALDHVEAVYKKYRTSSSGDRVVLALTGLTMKIRVA